MTQEEIARRLGVSQQAVSKWYSGKSLPKGIYLVRLAKLLGKDTEAVLNDFLKKKHTIKK